MNTRHLMIYTQPNSSIENLARRCPRFFVASHSERDPKSVINGVESCRQQQMEEPSHFYSRQIIEDATILSIFEKEQVWTQSSQ